MQKAEQHKLLQETNKQVIDIRQLEINYLVRIKKAYAWRASLLGGFTGKIFLSAPNNTQTWAKDMHSLYYIFCAICIASAVHVILTTMFLTTFGPGLALNGPIGSVAK